MPRLVCIIAAALFALTACGGGGNGPDPQPLPRFFSEMVAMTDGIKLVTDVHLPDGDGPFPVILLRTPYLRSQNDSVAADSNARAIAVVVQSMRGRFGSEGENTPFSGSDLGNNQDGYDTCAWITQQTWCNGMIATLGGSAMGMAQNHMAPTQPPGLVSQYIGVTPASMFHEFVYHGGGFREEQMTGWIEYNQFDPQSLVLYHAHPTYDNFWQQFSVREHAPSISLPAIHFGCWFDTFCQGTIDGFLLRQHQGGSGGQGQQWLIMGPWVHGKEETTDCGGITLPPHAAAVPGFAYWDWMNFWLKGEANTVLQRPAVTYYVLGDFDDDTAPGNEWRFADDWPVPATDTPYYLQADGSLSTTAPDTDETSGWMFDPTDPCPTVGGRNLLIEAGIYDQSAIEERWDMLVFSTEPLAAPLEATGRVTCQLWISSDAVDTDVAVRLCDVYPDGRSLLIADGILRLRYRDSMEQTTLLTPGTIYEVEVDLWSTSIVFNAGHRIRLSVTSSNYPRWDRNPGTGERWTDGGTYVVQNNTLYHSATQASAVVLPVAL